MIRAAAITLTLLQPVADEPQPVICGFASFQVCGASPDNKSVGQWIVINPSILAVVGNPPESPPGCVRVTTVWGGKLYVWGTEATIAAAIIVAQRQLADRACSVSP